MSGPWVTSAPRRSCVSGACAAAGLRRGSWAEQQYTVSLVPLGARLPPTLALALAYLALLVRGQRALLLRSVLLTLLAVGISYLAIANNRVVSAESQATLAIGTLSVPLLLALCSVAGVILRIEAQLAWLLAVVSGAASGCGPCCSRSVGWRSHCRCHRGLCSRWLCQLSVAATMRLIGGQLTLALALSTVAQGLLRATQRSTAQDSDRLLMALGAIVPLGILLCWLLHEAVVVAWLILVVLLCERAVAELEPTGRYARLRLERGSGQETTYEVASP